MKELEKTELTSDLSVDVRVTNYVDYRSFLNAYFAEAQSKNPRFSYGAWAKKLGTKDTSTLTKIIRGHRNPGPKLIDEMISYFKFDDKEAAYFRSMIQLEKVKEESTLRLSILESLGKSGDVMPRKTISAHDFALISPWYGFAIRQLSKLKGFRLDPEWISKRLCYFVSTQQVSDMLENLTKLGLIHVRPDGTPAAKLEPIFTTDDQPNLHLQQHHQQMLDNAKKALSEVDINLREFTSLTFPMKQSKMAEAKKLIRKFKDDFDSLLAETPDAECDTVYQFQMQLFPLTKWDNA